VLLDDVQLLLDDVVHNVERGAPAVLTRLWRQRVRLDL
jgi:hypothetical protein